MNIKTFLGEKKGMSQIFTESGKVIPVTIIDISELVLAKKSVNSYKSHIGYSKKAKPSKAEIGNFVDLGYVPKKTVESSDDFSATNIGLLDLKGNLVGKYVNVTGFTKGKGFQGAVKRWGFSGGPKTHGQSDRLRAPGSIGAGTTPGRVLKGKKMAGRVGNTKKTIKNLEVVSVDKDNHLLLVRGSVPGKNGTILKITLI